MDYTIAQIDQMVEDLPRVEEDLREAPKYTVLPERYKKPSKGVTVKKYKKGYPRFERSKLQPKKVADKRCSSVRTMPAPTKVKYGTGSYDGRNYARRK